MGPYYQEVVEKFVPGATQRAVHSIWFEVLGEHGFVTFFVWLGITISGLVAAHRIIKRGGGRPELAWCVDLAKMSQVSVVAYCVAGSFLSLSYWEFYFTLLVAVAATHQYVRDALGEAAPGLQQAIARPPRLAVGGSAAMRGGAAIGGSAAIGGGAAMGAKARAGPAV